MLSQALLAHGVKHTQDLIKPDNLQTNVRLVAFQPFAADLSAIAADKFFKGFSLGFKGLLILFLKNAEVLISNLNYLSLAFFNIDIQIVQFLQKKAD